jgi:alcohol dehydrogenase (cytochrome c)
MTIKRLLIAWLLLAPALLMAQSGGLDPASLFRPPTESWPTYSGDLTGRRYSPLKLVNKSNVKSLSLAWVARGFTEGSGANGGNRPYPLSVGGLGSGEYNSGGPASIRGSIVMVDGVLYPTSPDNVWAVDARDGTILWQYYWKTRGGTHTGHRGVGMWRNFIFTEFHDNYLVKLDARTGKEQWRAEISDFDQQYFSSMAPIIIDDHVIVGTGNDLDMPGFVQSYDPETGKRKWIFYTVPMNPGDPGVETWPSLDAARHGGAQVWVPGVFDPETRNYIFGTGNPTPAYTPAGRGEDDKVGLFTCSLVAVNVDTGKMSWYYQTSPRDMHDWDSAQTPILIDAVVNGRPRKLVSTAARNGYFFTVDRITGEHVATSRFGTVANWAKGLDAKGRPVLNPEKVATIPGAIVNGSITNWPPPAYSPDTGLFYVPENNQLSIVYLIDPDPRGSMGLGGRQGSGIGNYGNFVTAIEPRTGKVAWRHPLPGGGGATGMLTTGGGLLFAGDGAGNLVAFDATTGTPLWNARIGNVTNAPQTYLLDGKQYVLAAAGDMLYAFRLN